MSQDKFSQTSLYKFSDMSTWICKIVLSASMCPCICPNVICLQANVKQGGRVGKRESNLLNLVNVWHRALYVSTIFDYFLSWVGHSTIISRISSGSDSNLTSSFFFFFMFFFLLFWFFLLFTVISKFVIFCLLLESTRSSSIHVPLSLKGWIDFFSYV